MVIDTNNARNFSISTRKETGMAEKNETAAFENPAGAGGNKDTNGKPRYRRRRHNRTGAEKDAAAPARNAADTERDASVHAAEAAAVQQADPSSPEHEGERVGGQNETKKDRGRRHMRNNRSKGARRALQEDAAGVIEAAGTEAPLSRAETDEET